MKQATLRLVPLDRVRSHPDHPRLLPREDVVGGIAARLGGEYPRQHAVIVRPAGDDFQLVSGSLRVEAARRVGLSANWAWVRDLDDEATLVELVSSNSQGELSPPEIGLHVLKTVPKAEGGRGKKGGLSAYAVRLRMDESYLRQLVKAAEVATETPELAREFHDRTQHLRAVHRTHRSVWPTLAELVVEKDWSVKETERAAVKIAEVFGRDFDPGGGPWWGVFLPPPLVAKELACNTDFTAQMVVEQKLSVAEVARRLGVSQTLLHTWKKAVLESGTNAFPGSGHLTPQEEEIRKFRAEVKGLEAERDILKNATVFFASQANGSSPGLRNAQVSGRWRRCAAPWGCRARVTPPGGRVGPAPPKFGARS